MAAIYDMEDGAPLAEGLQGSNNSDEAWRSAQRLALELGAAVHLSDDDGEWRVEPSGDCESLISAHVTGRGADSSVPRRGDAVDADIYVGESLVGSVTLLEHEVTGVLDAWGEMDMWASPELMEFMDYGDRDLQVEIVSVVRDAAR